MNPNAIGALAALAGALIGGLASIGSSWLTNWLQARARAREGDRARREALYTEFINEATRLYGDALSHEKDDVLSLVRLYALVGRIRLMASPAVVAGAQNSLDAVIDCYLAPNRSLHELRALMAEDKMTFLVDFSEACRVELETLERHPSV